MPQKTAEQNLNEIFSLYAPFWEGWSQYKKNGLTKRDLYLVEVLKSSGFKIQPGDTIMFYNRPAAIERVSQKLKQQYQAYQRWATLTFLFALINLLSPYNDVTPETKFSKLPIDGRLKAILQRFGCTTIDNLFKLHLNKELHAPEMFGNILLFQATLRKKTNKPYETKRIRPKNIAHN